MPTPQPSPEISSAQSPLLEAARTVTLDVCGSRIDCIVFRSGDKAAILIPQVLDPEVQKQLAAAPVTGEITSTDGTTKAVCVQSPVSLIALVASEATPPSKANRRRHPRAITKFDAQVSADGQTWQHAEGLNISRSGCLLSGITQLQIPMGQVVALRLNVPDLSPVFATAEVIRQITPKNTGALVGSELALRFKHISELDADAIAAFAAGHRPTLE